MAKQRPSLAVAATPVSTYISPGNVPLAGVELYDEQTVRLAQEFSNAFKDLSVSAAGLAAGLKKQQNAEDIEAGRTMVLQSQKSYQQLVQSGEIKPSENPWMAIGAQEASGTVQGLNARAQFMALYDEKSKSDPKFFENPDSFNALASSYAQEMNNVMGDASYMVKSFYDSFNPFVASMALKHEENVVADRQRKMEIGVGAAVAQTVQDMNSLDPKVRETALNVLQEQVDSFGRQSMSMDQINDVLEDNILSAWAQSDNPQQLKKIWESMPSGTGKLADTKRAKAKFAAIEPKIRANEDRMTAVESNEHYEWTMSKAQDVVAGKITMEQLREEYLALTMGEDRKWTFSPNEIESKWGFTQSQVASTVKAVEEQIAASQYDSTLSRMQFMADSITLKDLDNPIAFRDKMDMLVNSLSEQYNFTAERRLQLLEKSRTMSKQALEMGVTRRNDTLTRIAWNGSDRAGTVGISREAASQFAAFIGDTRDQSLTGQMLVTPSFDKWKQELEQTRMLAGIVPGSPEANKMQQEDYMKLSQMLDNMAASANMMPQPGDTDQIRTEKARQRGRVLFLKLNLGRTFNNSTEASRMLNTLVSAFNPATVQEGAIGSPLEEVMWGYAMYRGKGLPLGDLFKGEYGDAVKQEVEWAIDQMQRGGDVSNIVADLSQRKSIGGYNWFEMESNPLGWARWFTADAKDAEAFQVSLLEARTAMEVTNPDSYIPLASAVSKAYVEFLKEDKDHETAMTKALNAVSESHIVFRGSLIPKSAVTSFGVEDAEAGLAAWTDFHFPNENATLVVVHTNPDGTAVFAPRTEDGRLVPNGKLINSADLKRTPQMLPAYVEALNTRRKAEAQKTVERTRRFGQPSAGVMLAD